MRTRQAHEWMGALTGPGARLLSLAGQTEDEVENIYGDYLFGGDHVTYPDAQRAIEVYEGAKFDILYEMLAEDKTEMRDEWTIVESAVQGGLLFVSAVPSGWTAAYIIDKGRYIPSQVAAGRTENTLNWSTKYDAMRGVIWDYYIEPNPSDGHYYMIAERPTVGSTNFGGIYVTVDRNNSSQWRILTNNGDGGTSSDFIAGAVSIINDTSALQFEFVKGSHVTLKMYANVHNALDFSGFSMPTWPIAESGNYVKRLLNTGTYAQLTPISPLLAMQSSLGTGATGRIHRWAFECRAVGGAWKYLV